MENIVVAEEEDSYFGYRLVVFSDRYFGFKNIKTGKVFGHYYSATNFEKGYAVIKEEKENGESYLDIYGHVGKSLYTDPITKKSVAIQFKNKKLGVESFLLNDIKDYLTLCPTLFTRLPDYLSSDENKVKKLFKVTKLALRNHLEFLKGEEDPNYKETDLFIKDVKKIGDSYKTYLKKIENKKSPYELDLETQSNFSKMEEAVVNLGEE